MLQHQKSNGRMPLTECAPDLMQRLSDVFVARSYAQAIARIANPAVMMVAAMIPSELTCCAPIRVH
jgi:predicted metal-binding membrane protein